CFFFQAEDGIRDFHVTGVQTCALPISWRRSGVPADPRPVRELGPSQGPRGGRGDPPRGRAPGGEGRDGAHGAPPPRRAPDHRLVLPGPGPARPQVLPFLPLRIARRRGEDAGRRRVLRLDLASDGGSGTYHHVRERPGGAALRWRARRGGRLRARRLTVAPRRSGLSAPRPAGTAALSCQPGVSSFAGGRAARG